MPDLHGLPSCFEKCHMSANRCNRILRGLAAARERAQRRRRSSRGR
ncbi:MAG: hypothetical protein OXU61_11525 [Gammaproteobacteria bacterium]|nr:hypothetical protein [Gammaproteobacteria bacterium]